MTEKPTILFVDDEERILRSLKILFMTRYSVLATTDGREALEMVKQKRVHVVVSDQRMPLMLGAELLHQIRQVSPNTIRLLLTGYSDLQAIIDSVNQGEIFRYINKPWQTQEIKDIITKAVDIALRLEKQQSQQHPAKATKTGTTNTTEEPIHVLVLDTDENIFSIINKLSNNNYITHWAQSLDEALLILESRKIAVLISDIQLAGEDITASIKVLKEYRANILTVILSSFQDTKTLIGLINQGQIYRFLPKPAHENLLAKSLAAAIRRYQTLETTPELSVCHSVEKFSEEAHSKSSGGVLSFISRIRGLYAKSS